MTLDPLRAPTDAEIDLAQEALGFIFPSDYRAFLKGGDDVANAVFEPAIVLPGCSRLDLVEIANTAWTVMGVSRRLLPFIEDNGDYFCLSANGEVTYWSHNGSVNESWSNLATWYQQVCVDRL